MFSSRAHSVMDTTTTPPNVTPERTRTPNPPSPVLHPSQEQHPTTFSNPNASDRTSVDLNTMATSSKKLDSSPTTYPPRPYSQLPTPQSPSNFGYYVPGTPYTPGSPVPNGSQASRSYPSSSGQQPQRRIAGEEERVGVMAQQVATPESSPFTRTTTRYTSTATPKHTHSPSRLETLTPKGRQPFVPLEAPLSSSILAPAPQISSPMLSPSGPRSSQLSSPFMAKLSMTDQSSKTKASRPQSTTPEPHSMQVDDLSAPAMTSSTTSNSGSISIVSPPQHTAGGEMERIRLAMVQDRLAYYQEVESRRPEYLKRAKRTLSEEDPSTQLEDESYRDGEREVVGIMESPVKGRRLKLFQETSEESFEESLMAGGYGRYRTADWVRQPQPIVLTAPGVAGPSKIVSALEQAEEPAPPTEKELRKRKRLAAFSDCANRAGYTKLHPVDLEGRGRVLLDIPPDSEDVSVAEGTPSKKKATPRRKKKGELTAREKKALALAAAAAGDLPDKPNWPDTEFPWRLRTEERADELKAREAEKMKWIERFLDRDSDDDDDDEVVGGSNDETAFARGRGKMVPIPVYSVGPRSFQRKSTLFPSDPADARAALMSKKSVRTLSYRQQKRQRQQADDESDDEVLCICNGRDDGRELVQCDACETWYHLQCIGIKDIAELGREEDEWFCRNCEAHRRSGQELLNEPTFVPTDERPRVSPSFDGPFFQTISPQDSPMAWDPPRLPRTPTRNIDSEYEPRFSSGSSWVGSSMHRPSTPPRSTQVPRDYNSSTSGSFDSFSHQYDESPFDPTSTPSRGIKFSAAFTTPKNNVWSSRANGLFQTPSRQGVGRISANMTFGGTGMLSAALDEGGGGYDHGDSPIRRVRSSEGPKARHVSDSPLASRSGIPIPHHLLDESPVMRYNDIERRNNFNNGPAS